MELSEIFKLVAANGVFAVLFLFLLIYELRDSRTREKKYQETIDNLADRLEVVIDIKEDVEKIRDLSIIKSVKKNPPQKMKES